MLWLYERGFEDLHIETSFDNATNEYVIVLRKGQQNETTERFGDNDSFGARVEALRVELTRDRWQPTGPPIFLKKGWKIG
jgi:hypothetical protein